MTNYLNQKEKRYVTMVAQMRDLDTTAAALTAAERGCLLLTTLHTSGGLQAIDRFTDLFSTSPAPTGERTAFHYVGRCTLALGKCCRYGADVGHRSRWERYQGEENLPADERYTEVPDIVYKP